MSEPHYLTITDAIPDLPGLIAEAEDAIRRNRDPFVTKCTIHARLRACGAPPGVTAQAIGVVDGVIEDTLAYGTLRRRGTTGGVANRLGRHSVLVELNPAYVPMIEKRTAQLPLGAIASSPDAPTLEEIA